ncbi:protein DBF4 homolog B [Podarcis raffonei]|uniref:protein DBF4 homolog B n=1 Tax=Podarcis raffonei TaxID=65483 RepID=UPI0023296454|nr:protein DBF4 homolog B [Podarcis raffonei]
MADWTLRHWQNLASLDGRAQKSRLKATRKREEAARSARSRPLVGKSFYLDLPRGKNLEFLAESVKQLGGVVESFLSKEVTCVVSSSQEARRERWMEKQSSSALKDAQTVSRPSAELQRGPSHKPIDTNLISRGKKLLHKAIRGQDSTCGNSILATSRSWGVQIIHIDEMLSYIRLLSKKHPSTAKVKLVASGFQPSEVVRLKAPFLKIEDESRQLRPFFQQFKNFPQLYFRPLRRHSPFQPPRTSSSSKAPESKRSPNELFPPSACCIMPKPQKGYCECCEEVFAELQMHLQSQRHKEFALDPSHYTLVDSILSQLTNDFVVSSSSPPLRVPPSGCSGDYSEFRLEDYCMFAGGQTVNPEASAHLLEDQDFLHLAELPLEMLLTPVPFGSLGSAYEHHKVGRLVSSTRSEAAASAEADRGAVPQERGLLVQPAVLSRKRKLSGSLHGQARKKRALSKHPSDDRLPDEELLLPGNQQAGTTGCPPNQMASRPLGFSAVPFSNLGPSHLTWDSLSSEPLAIDTGCLQEAAPQLGQGEVAALSPYQEKDACISWDFPSPSIESRSMSGFPMGKHIDISELAWCVTSATGPRS